LDPIVMLLVLLGSALHATWNGLLRGGKDRYLGTAALVACAGALTLLWIPFLPAPLPRAWTFLAISAVIHQVYYALIAASYHRGEMSVVYPTTRGAAPALTALGSALLLGEHPTARSVAGVLLVSGGVGMLALDHARGAHVNRTALLLALANAGVVALYTLVDGYGVRLSGNAASYTSWGFLICALLFTPTALAVRGREVVDHLRGEWRGALIGGGCSIAAYGLALWAMTRAPIASVAALRETAIVFGVLLAAITLKERVTPLRAAAVIIVACGAIVIRFG
jgi:drug/metabolite transporter (DMT)-like permease